MANKFNAKFNLNFFTPLTANTYNIIGDVIDNTGNFYAGDVKVNDVIYNDASMIALGVLRYKVTSVNSINSSTIDVNVKWDLDPEPVQDPISSAQGCIGTPDSAGNIYITDASQQNLDLSFTNAVRNTEIYLLTQNIIAPTADVMLKSEYDVNVDKRIDEAAMPPVLDLGTF
jgi:hypothetical protein